ncbi:MAG: hypothetical protein JNM31_01240 [Flavobacteriales bacterium]|nr:hypothetical protein [Flavobacteriales bacterium]
MRRRILVPWLLASVVMFGLSFLWHGVFLRDLVMVRLPMGLYFTLAALVYLLVGMGITLAVHQAIVHEWINLKHAFPFMSMLVGAIVGFIVFLIVFTLGFSFTKDGMVHMLVDVLWQMFEQAMGGLMVSLGIIYDLHRSFLEQERAK